MLTLEIRCQLSLEHQETKHPTTLPHFMPRSYSGPAEIWTHEKISCFFQTRAKHDARMNEMEGLQRKLTSMEGGCDLKALVLHCPT